MTVNVLLFAHLRDILGDAVVVDAAEVSTAGDVCAELARRDERIGASLSSTRLAVNGEWATASTIMSDGDELALIPPVSGG